MRYILFTTPTCPKCPAMKEYVEALEMEGVIASPVHKDFKDLAEEYGVTTAPTLVITDGYDNWVFTDISEVETFMSNY